MIIKSSSVGSLQTWEPTQLLRWKRSDDVVIALMELRGQMARTLQQMWKRVDSEAQGETKWVDVRTQDENEE